MQSKGNFFAVDWRCVRAAGMYGNGPNAAAAYIALARFSGGSNSTTRAAVTALHSYLGMSRGRAAQALVDLENSGLVTIPTRGTTRKIVKWSAAKPNIGEFTERQMDVFKRISGKDNPIKSSADVDYQVAYALAARGIVDRCKNNKSGSLFQIPAPDLVYLPNSLVDGFDTDEPPLSRLRHLRDRRAFNILMDVYRLSNIAEDGGLSTDIIRSDYNRVLVGRWGIYTIYAFNMKGYGGNFSSLTKPFMNGILNKEGLDAGAQEFWALWWALHDAGLIETVEYLFSDTNGGEPLHPMSLFSGTVEERKVAEAANSAGIRMASDARLGIALDEIDALPCWSGAQAFLCPVPSHIMRAQVIGVTRPVHRANTSRTRAWATNFLQRCEAHRLNFARLAPSSAKSAA